MSERNAPGTATEPVEPAYPQGMAKFRVHRQFIRSLQPLIAARDTFLYSERPLIGRSGHAVSAADGLPVVPFFILGSPRSGTTMLREILNRHSQLFIPPENSQLQAMIRTFGALRRAPWDAVVDAVVDQFAQAHEAQFWALDSAVLKTRAQRIEPKFQSLASIFDVIYRAYGEHHAPGKAIWGDKSTPGHFEYLGKLGRVFPNSKYIHIVRDGRDSVLSCVRTGFYDRSAIKAAYAWADNSRSCRRFGRRRESTKFMQIRYEDLVTRPEEQVSRVLEMLGMPAEMSILNTLEDTAKASPDVKSLKHHQNAMKPISVSSVGNWKRGLSPSCITAITPIIRSELRIHGYDVS